MTPREARAALDELSRASGGRAQLLADRLRAALREEPWVDALLAREIEARVRPHLPVSAWEAKRLRAGETWLLLYLPNEKRGATVRLRTATRSPDVFSADAIAALQKAREGLLAALGRACRSLRDPERLCFDVASPRDPYDIDGPSLGVASCVATISEALQRPPAMEVAASAEVRSDGSLAPVAFLGEKLVALAEQWPCVRRVVVAVDQEIPAVVPAGIELVRRRSLRDAIADFGLDLERLEPACADEYATFVDGLQGMDARDHGTAEWVTLSARALEAAHVLNADGGESKRATKAIAYAALFALHGGDPDAASRRVDLCREWGLLDAELPASLRVFLEIVAATRAIDSNPDEAIATARSAVEDAKAASDQENLGRACGTLGRALMHAGRLEEALPVLRETADVHWRSEPHERLRSATYVMICLRKLGRAEEALALARRTEAEIASRQRAMLRKTLLYVRLERGRALIELERFEEAIGALEPVREAQQSDEDYPRLGATRSLSMALRAMGRIPDADVRLEACLATAERDSAKPTVRRIAAIAAIEVLVHGGETRVPTARLEDAARIFPEAKDAVAREALLRRWVY